MFKWNSVWEYSLKCFVCLGESPQLRCLVWLPASGGKRCRPRHCSGRVWASHCQHPTNPGEASLAPLHLSVDQLRPLRGVGGQGKAVHLSSPPLSMYQVTYHELYFEDSPHMSERLQWMELHWIIRRQTCSVTIPTHVGCCRGFVNVMKLIFYQVVDSVHITTMDTEALFRVMTTCWRSCDDFHRTLKEQDRCTKHAWISSHTKRYYPLTWPRTFHKWFCVPPTLVNVTL